MTTTTTVEGRPIQEYLGVVHGEAVIGANAIRDFFANIRDVIGGRAGGYERVLRKAREQAYEDMQTQAGRLRANAIVGIDVDYEVLGAENGMLMVTACGTAVLIEE